MEDNVGELMLMTCLTQPADINPMKTLRMMLKVASVERSTAGQLEQHETIALIQPIYISIYPHGYGYI